MTELVWKCPYCPSEKGWNAPSLSHCGDCGEIKPLAIVLQDAPEWMDERSQKAAKTRKTASKGQKQASKKEAKPSKKSKLEEDFFSKWQSQNIGHTMDRQYVIKSKRHFTPVKRQAKTYKVDFCIVGLALCIEIQGGQWSGGRHQRGGGYAEDRRRVRDLTFEGWTVLEYTTDDIQDTTVNATIAEVNEFVYQLEQRRKAA